MVRSAAKKNPVLAFCVIIIALLVLSGMLHLDREFLMSTSTAVTFLVAATSKILFQYAANNKKTLILARVLALCTLLIGLLRISTIAFGYNSLDFLFVGNTEAGYPNSMVLVTAVGFVFTGIALYLLTLHNAEKIFWPHLLSIGILFIALLSAIAIAFNENLFYEADLYDPMRISAAICFSLLAVSMLLINKHKGFVGDLISEHQGGKIARMLIPIAIVIPIILGIQQLRAGSSGIFTRPYDLALLTLGRIIILVVFIWRVAVIINRSNKKLLAEIEERKKNEENLRYKKAVLEAQNEAIPDAVLVVDTEGKILSYNHRFGSLWCLPECILKERDDVEALKFAVTQLNDPEEFINRVNYIYAHPEETAHDELQFKDGRIIERYGNVVVGDDGTKYGWAWYFRDITQNKNYEKAIKDFNKDLEIKVRERTEELNKSEMRFRLLVENSLDIISLIDFEGCILYMSPSIKRLTGFTEKELKGRSGFELLHPNDVKAGKQFRQSLIDMPAVPTNNTFRLKHKKGGYIWVEGTVTNMLNDENINAFILNYHDVTERKTAEESIRNSEKRFRSLVENAEDIISLSDENGMRFYVSPAIERITGYSIPETLNQPVFDILHPDDREYAKNIRDEIVREPGVLKQIVFRFLHKNGSHVWIEGTLVNLLHDENVKAIVGNFHDITERKKAEENLRNSEKRFRSLIENSNDLISLSDGNTNLFYVSPSVERITGYTIEETINRSVFSFVHPGDIKHGEMARQHFLKNPGVSIPLSFRYRHKNGNYIWMEGTIVNLLNDENVKAVVGNYHDVTERKINEEKVRLSNERFEMVSKATNDAVWDWNLETDEIHWNEEIRSMFNYCAEDIPTGSEWKTHIHKEDFKRVTKKLVYHIKNGIQNWQDEYRFLCADGSYKFVFNRGFILFDSNNKPYRIIGAMQDVTEINKLHKSLNDERIKKQKELNMATIEGQEKERTEIGRELHDNINQLLTATKLYLDVAATQPAMKDEMIHRSTGNLSRCMEEIRKLSSALVPPSIGINRFSDIIQDLIEPIKLGTDINVVYEVKEVNDRSLSKDQLLNVYRIIQEHLNNIVKHSKAKNVLISVRHIKDQVQINIKDDGQGFDTSGKRKGIGFKNIQSRAELLNGKMNIISKPDEGCLLAVNFPVSNNGI